MTDTRPAVHPLVPAAELAPELFDPASIAPDTARFNEELERAIAAAPSVHTLPPAVIRQAREEGRGIWGPIQRVAEAKDRTIPGPGGAIPIRVYVPPQVRGVYLHLHGGGWMLGAAHHSDVRNWAIARHARLAVVSVNYRLSPEHPYPAGPDDCEAAALWLVKNAQSEFGSDRLSIGGESAGAHLSLVTMLRLRDRHGLTPFRAANLVYGAYDLAMTPSVRRWGERNLVLSTPIIGWFTSAFVPDPTRRADPDVSPIHADLAGLPPSLLTVGTLDPLLDDSLFLWPRLRAARVRAELAVYPGGVHGFNAFPIELARLANARAEHFLAMSVER
ncbi:MAG TPA: alpha/beta hydrolase [Myxococcota bacterium]|nr:alpha/beta hydrolase [Myxococcota bacterium]